MLAWVEKIVILSVVLYGAVTVYAYEQQILKEKDLNYFAKLLEKKDLKKQDFYLIISRLDYLGEHDPEAFVLLGDLYSTKKLFREDIAALPESERLARAIQYYQKASPYLPAANLKLAEIYISDKERHLSYILKAAQLGDTKSKETIKKNLDAGWCFQDETLNVQVHAVCNTKQVNKSTPESNKIVRFAHSAAKNQSDSKSLIKQMNNFLIRFVILSIIGLFFAYKKKIYLFYNKADAVITVFASFSLLILFMKLFGGASLRERERIILFCIIGIILLMLLLFSIITNTSMWWSFIIVIPAKCVIGILGGLFAFLAIANALEVVENKQKKRGQHIFLTIVWGFFAYRMYKIITDTTKNKS